MEFPTWLTSSLIRSSDPHDLPAPREGGGRTAEAKRLDQGFRDLLSYELSEAAYADFFGWIRDAKDRAFEIFTFENLKVVQEASADVAEAQANAWSLLPRSPAMSVQRARKDIGNSYSIVFSVVQEAHTEAIRRYYDAVTAAETNAVTAFYEVATECEAEAFAQLETASLEVLEGFSEALSAAVARICRNFRRQVHEARSCFLEELRSIIQRCGDVACEGRDSLSHLTPSDPGE